MDISVHAASPEGQIHVVVGGERHLSHLAHRVECTISMIMLGHKPTYAIITKYTLYINEIPNLYPLYTQ